MINYEKGDIVLVPFPFSNQTISKKRPAVIISSNHYNYASFDIIIMAITGQIEKSITVNKRLGMCWFIETICHKTRSKNTIINEKQTSGNESWYAVEKSVSV
ncbi:MAG: type II toxin-antitoxin system PemK/MazF family toxin [Candidatus Firestonebacteria bacterium]|nr:type II toxin-antitoxin system PemK/MazF family toxin [Candidatus Firestonebacteria bacterium]